MAKSPTPDATALSERLTFALSTRTDEALEEAAAAKQRSVSDVVRLYLEECLQRDGFLEKPKH